MQTIRSIFITSVLPAAVIVASAYQGLMAVNGPEGLYRRAQLEAEKLRLSEEVRVMTEERGRLEARADRLTYAGLDEDLLEERVRAELGHMKPGEYRIALSELDAVAEEEADENTELTSLIAVALLTADGV
ncbi:MAG: septum formation initiator family protein [Parvularcula sp.]|jgi:cell division protein FtsB|nr:septum formation initiator family protein [Parvularcula sp.]